MAHVSTLADSLPMFGGYWERMWKELEVRTLTVAFCAAKATLKTSSRATERSLTCAW